MDMQGWFERWMRRLPEELIALSIVLYLLSGRWSFARIDPSLGQSQPLYEPRFLLVPAMYAVLMFAWRRTSFHQPESTKGIVRVALSLVVFLSYMMCTALWARDAELASAKFIELLLVMLAVLACVWAWSLCDSHFLREAIFRYLLVFCGLLALLGLRSIADARLAVLGGGPNVYGRNMCLLAAACLYFWKNKGNAWLWLPGVALAFVLVILTGSRGALVAFFALTLTYVILARRRLPTTIASLLALMVVTYFALVDSAVWDAVERTFRSRVIELTLEQRRDAGRGQLFTGALELSMQQPLFGNGLASGRAYLGQYPHNLFLEALSDGGLFGLGLLLICFLVVGLQLLAPSSTIDSAGMSTFLMLLSSSQFSGDFYDSRGVFLFMPLIVVGIQNPKAHSPVPDENHVQPAKAAA